MTTFIPSSTLEEVGDAIARGAVSAVGHQETAAVISTLTSQPIAANRITVKPQVGDIFFCFSLKQRPPEAAVLSREQLEAIGYQWARMEYGAAA